MLFRSANFARGCVLQSRDNIACRALEQSDDVSEEFFLRLDSCELVKFVSTYKSALLNVSGFEFRLGKTFFAKLLDEFGGGVSHLCVHDSGVTLEGGDYE